MTHRGHTGHEMLDHLGLVHANGRVYDPALGRFLSVDPVFQFPTNSQSLNPYSYVLNNPLSLTDPSGYCASAADNENSANTSVCGQGDNNAGNHEYNGKNANDGGTGSHAGFQAGFNGQDLHSLTNAHLSNLFASAGIKLDANTRVIGGQFENGAKFGQAITEDRPDSQQSGSGGTGTPLVDAVASLGSTNGPASTIPPCEQGDCRIWPKETEDADNIPYKLVIDYSNIENHGIFSTFHYKLFDIRGKELIGPEYKMEEHLWADKAETIEKIIGHSSTTEFEHQIDGEFPDDVGFQYPLTIPNPHSYQLFQSFSIQYPGGPESGILLRTEFEHKTTVDKAGTQNIYTNDVIDVTPND